MQVLDSNLGPLEKQPVLLTAEQSPQPPKQQFLKLSILTRRMMSGDNTGETGPEARMCYTVDFELIFGGCAFINILVLPRSSQASHGVV